MSLNAFVVECLAKEADMSPAPMPSKQAAAAGA